MRIPSFHKSGSAPSKQSEQSVGAASPPIWICTAPGDHMFASRLAQGLAERAEPVDGTWRASGDARPESMRAFVFVLSPESATHQSCLGDLDHAVRTNQRIVHVVARETPAALIPAALLPLRPISFRAEDNFSDSLQALAERVESELRVDVFLSYSRLDSDFVDELEKALWKNGRTVWVDRKKLLPTELWNEAILDAIEAADNFVFLVTPNSLASKYVDQEVNHALALKKRIIPLLLKPVNPAQMPSQLSARQYISFLDDLGNLEFDRGVRELIRVLDSNPEWIHAHARLLVKADDWIRHHKHPSYLLRGEDLKAAEKWRQETPAGTEFQPSQLHLDYLAASRRMAMRVRWLGLASVAAAALVLAALGVVGLQSQKNERIARIRAEAAAFGSEAVDAENRNDWLTAERARRNRLERLEQLAAELPNDVPATVQLANGYGQLALAILKTSKDPVQAVRDTQKMLDTSATVTDRLHSDSESYTELSSLCTNIAHELEKPDQKEMVFRLSERAFEIDEFLVTRFPKDDDYANDLAISAHDLAGVTKDRQRALTLEQEVLRLRLELSERNPGESPRQLEYARAHGFVGSAHYALQDYENALKAYRASLKAHQLLAEWEGASKEIKHELGIAHFDVGKTLDSQGQLVEAEAEYAASLAVAKAVAKGEKSNTKFFGTEAYRQRSLDVIASAIGKLGESIGHSREAVRLFQRRVDDSPSNSDFKNDLAWGRLNLGADLLSTGDLSGAHAEYSAAIGILEQVAARRNATAEQERSLCRALRSAGDLILSEGKTEAASKNYDRSTKILERLIAKDPDNRLLKTDLRTSLQSQASICSTFGRLPEAAWIYEKAFGVAEELWKLEPKNPSRALDLSYSCTSLASTRFDQGCLDDALALYQRAANLVKPLSDRAPQQLIWQRAYVTSEDGLAITLKYQGHFAEAAAHFQRCLELRRAHAAKDERNLSWAADAAWAGLRFAYACALQGDAEQFLRLGPEMIALRTRLCEKNPASASYRASLVQARADFADALDFLGRHADAASQCELAAVDGQKLVQLDPRNAIWKSNLAGCHQTRGEALLALGKYEDAVHEFSAARGIRRTLAELSKEHANWNANLVNCERQLALALLKLGKLSEAVGLADHALATSKALCANPQGGFYPARNYGRCLRVRALIAQASGKPAEAIALLEESYAVFSRWKTTDPTYLPVLKDLAEDRAALATAIVAAGGPQAEHDASIYREEARALAKSLKQAIGRDVDSLVDILPARP